MMGIVWTSDPVIKRILTKCIKLMSVPLVVLYHVGDAERICFSTTQNLVYSEWFFFLIFPNQQKNFHRLFQAQFKSVVAPRMVEK